jgi:hypothetical protein
LLILEFAWEKGYEIMKKQVKTVICSAIVVAIFILGTCRKTAPQTHAVAPTTLPQDSTTTLALHVSGKNIEYPNGTVAYLRGVDYTWFVNAGGGGSWVLSDGRTDWNVWSQPEADYFLSEMQSWGCNVIHVYGTVEYWVDDTNDFRENLKTFISDAGILGMYVEFTFWDITDSGSDDTEPSGVLPWNVGGNSYLTDKSDFVNLWTSVATTLQGYNNVLFELWNEPNGANNLPADHSADEVAWMDAAQDCITAIRGTGADNIVVVQWGYGVGTGGYDMSWVTDYPLNDSTGNLVYSTHLYRSNFDGDYEMNDVTSDYTTAGLFSLDYPLFVGEIGCDMNATDLANEETWYNNSLTLLNENGISYCGFTAPPNDGQWALVAGDYVPNAAGTMLINAIAAGGTTGPSTGGGGGGKGSTSTSIPGYLIGPTVVVLAATCVGLVAEQKRKCKT